MKVLHLANLDFLDGVCLKGRTILRMAEHSEPSSALKVLELELNDNHLSFLSFFLWVCDSGRGRGVNGVVKLC